MEVLLEKIVIYSIVFLVCFFVILYYLRKQRKNSLIVEEKIRHAKDHGLYEPVSLHPVVDVNSCIQTGACIKACPEKDILGIVGGKATIVNASRCVGHGACFHACPTEAITLCIGTEIRGVDLPHIDKTFETNMPGIFIAGELGGMGLIKNAVEQGRQAVENITKLLNKNHKAQYDLVIVGAGPAGISAALTAKKNGLNFLLLEQDTLGGTVATFPRSKIVMTSPMDISLHGKAKFFETSKSELLEFWNMVMEKNQVTVKENIKVEKIEAVDGCFNVICKNDQNFNTAKVLLAIGRRGSPRKLNIPGEVSEKVAYRLLEPENIKNKNIIVVGGGDSAVESALLLAGQNNVILSYRGEVFKRLKEKNKQRIQEAQEGGICQVIFNSNLLEITETKVFIEIEGNKEHIENDLVYIFAGGELPIEFLKKSGILITKKFGEAVLKH